MQEGFLKSGSSFVVGLLRQPMDRALPLPSRGPPALDFLGGVWLVQNRLLILLLLLLHF